MQNTSSLTMLKTAMRSNAVFSSLTALAFILVAAPIGKAIGISPSSILTYLGVGLAIFAVELFVFTRKDDINETFAQIVIAGDLLWVLGSIIVFFSSAIPLTTAGKWFVAIQADIVLIFAVWQYFGLKKSNK